MADDSLFEDAARRVRQGAKPEGGRKEGPATHVLGNYLPHVLKSLTTLPQRATEAAGELQATGDQYDPGPALETAMGMVGARTPFVKPGELGVFGGRGAANADLHKLTKANDIIGDASPANMERALQETGWFYGADGKPRFEINDQGAKLKPSYLDWASTHNNPLSLQEGLHHPELFEAYPGLGELPLVQTSKAAGYSNYGQGPHPTEPWREIGPHIGINVNRSDERQLSTLLHELQHHIQKKEDFAPGSSSTAVTEKYVKDRLGNDERKLPSEADVAAYEVYRRSAGETEARNVQARATGDVSPEIPPWQTQDVPSHKQVFPWERWTQHQIPEIQSYIMALTGNK